MIFCNFTLEMFLIIQLFFEKSVQISVVLEEVIPDLYSKYKEALLDEKSNTSSRRLFKRNKQYEIHVKKLKEVNGFKKHNLVIKENLRTGDNNNSNPYIYINNPVESKIPKSFLTLEEFKEVLTNRVKSQRNEMATKQVLKITNLTKLTTEQRVNKSKRVSRKLGKTTKVKTDTTIENFKYKVNGTSDKQQQILISKTVATNKTKVTTVKLDKINVSRNELNNVNLVNNNTETEIMIPYKTTKKLPIEIETINTNLEPKIRESSNPSTITFQTKEDIDETEVTTTPDYDKISSNSELFNENQLSAKSSDVQSNDTFTTLNDTKYEEESTTLQSDSDKNLENTSPEINSNDYLTVNIGEMTTTKDTTENPTPTETEASTTEVTRKMAKPKRTTTQKVSFEATTTENPTLTETEISTTQVTRKTAKPKRKTTQKVSFQVPRKRSTLGRPLVFMGSR